MKTITAMQEYRDHIDQDDADDFMTYCTEYGELMVQYHLGNASIEDLAQLQDTLNSWAKNIAQSIQG